MIPPDHRNRVTLYDDEDPFYKICLHTLKSGLHMGLAGPVYIFSDMALQVRTVDRFLYALSRDDDYFYSISIPLNMICCLTLLIQDSRLITKTLRRPPVGIKQLGNRLETFSKSTVGRVAEVITTSYRTISSKFSLYLLLVVPGNLFYFMAFQIYNPLSFYCKWTNNQTAWAEIGELSKYQMVFSQIQAFFLTLFYAIEDSSLYTHSISDILSLAPKPTAVALAILSCLEMIGYYQKSAKTSKNLIVMYSSCLKMETPVPVINMKRVTKEGETIQGNTREK
jgi:hypothetical protein